MAQDLDINVKIKSELDRANKDIGSLKTAGAFDGAQGAKALNRVQGLFTQLHNVDLSKLKGTQLTEFLNNLSKLRHYLDTAGRSLTNYSQEYADQLKKVEQATIAASKAQDKQAAALDKQKEALGKLDLTSKGYFYQNKGTGRKVTSPDTIAELYNKGQLQIFNNKGSEISGGAYNATTEKMGLKAYAEATKEVEQADMEVKNANIIVTNEQNKLNNTPMGATVHPVTAEVGANSQVTSQAITDIKEQVNAGKAEDIKNTTEAINNQNLALNRQTTSLGKAFRQFSIYAIALRTVKKALNEATKTIREIDRALTEQAMVTGLTRKQTYGLLKDYQDMASRLGTTTKEVSSTMTQFLRQGRSINESLKLTEAAVSAAKVAGISAADSINYLTTAINGFRLSADDAMKVSDKFAAVAASAATSYEEIAIALSKVAAQANLAGMSIDYTTALLTKGIETTREAPETIGTALKTVIARMRELSDYGETLGGDTDINNVESQLAYIGIALRDNNGELRSTEDVLNELGGKWDELNANQQAAIAKALAGTRQQSRLIAMMSDYEHVIELQEIAERSQGATMAQMATYMEGMDAALNKVNVAWEKIISTITDSDVIISLVDTFAALLENINSILSTTGGMIAAITLISLTGIAILGNKMRELEVTRLQRKYALEENKLQNEKNIAIAKENIEKLKVAKQNAKARLDAAQERKIQLASLAVEIQKRKLKGAIVTASEAWLKKEQTANEVEIQTAQQEYNQATQQLAIEEDRLNIIEKQQDILNSQSNLISSIGTGVIGMLVPLASILGFIKAIGVGIAAAKVYQEALNKGLDKQAAKEARNNALAGAGMFAKVVAAFASLGPWGVVAGIVLGTALAAAIGVAIAAATGNLPSQQESDAQKTAKDINKLSKEIYELNKKSQELNNVISKFEDLDNKILKTNKDLEEMATLLDSAADSLSDDEKEYFNTLDTTGKYHYLQEVQERTDRDLAAKRNAQRNKIIDLRSKGGQNWRDFITNSSNSAEITQAQAAIYSLNNAYLYEQIDEFKKLSKDNAKYAKDIEKMTQNMLSSLSVEKAAALLANPSQIDQYIQALGSRGDAASILQSDDYTISERVEAFEELRGAVAELGDPEILEAFKTINKEWQTFSTMSKDTLDYIDAIGADIDGINELASAIQKLGYTADESAEALDDMFQLLQTGANLHDTIADMFGIDNYDSILNAYDKAFGTTILNMGQNIDKFKNTVDGFYEKAAEWATMSDTDKTSFISEHADLFKGEQGGVLLQAFESGNYARIEEALRANNALSKQREQLINDIDKQLKIEYARQELDYAYIRELEQNKKELEDLSKVYLASLKMRYDQQQAQLEMYKDLLQKETDALTESLEKRKEAYQKYFDAINKEYEKEEYEEKAQTLIANIAKLGSSLNGDAVAKRADLTKQLEELEAERLKTLREQAQQAMISSIEDQVTQINENLEKLLTNEQALLAAIMNDTQNPSDMIASMMAAQAASGNNTELGMQNYLQQMQSTFASIMPNVDWSNIDVERQGDSLILNIMGQSVQLSDSDQQTIYEAIQSALKQLGYN